MRRLMPWLFLVALGAGALASAQEGSPVLKDKEAVTFNEIERGVYLGVGGGAAFVINPPANNDVRPFSSGQMAELELGVDFGERLALSFFLRLSENRESAAYTGQSSPTNVAFGDFTTFVPGVSARLKFAGVADSQNVERTWFYVRGGAGYATFSPKALLPNSDIFVFAGPGIEYYTRLRHFSIGVEAVGSVLVASKAVGFAITPNLRYAF